MDINICSIKRLKYDIVNVDLNNSYFIICSSYDYECLPQIADVALSLIFDDTTKFGARSFNEDLAQQIKDYVDTLPDSSTLYICCDEGVSRSSAIAAATLKYLGKDDMIIWQNPHYSPNLFVYSIMLNVYGFSIDDNELAYLSNISNNSLSNSINNQRL